ncbi:MAG: hypothetical protein II825_11325 [Paludibacteraceae bacterium]|nr:hypothetical protein [Paludibacteraceae bacterium]MBQ6777365.1 hypothetical protein [Paludibacteraceae bacterium]
MKRFLFLAIGLLMFAAMDAAPAYDVGAAQQSISSVQYVQTEVQPVVVDFVYVVSADVIETAAPVISSDYFYQAMPMEIQEQVYKIEMPVFRLCTRSQRIISNLSTGWSGQPNLPPNRYNKV